MLPTSSRRSREREILAGKARAHSALSGADARPGCSTEDARPQILCMVSRPSQISRNTFGSAHLTPCMHEVKDAPRDFNSCVEKFVEKKHWRLLGYAK